MFSILRERLEKMMKESIIQLRELNLAQYAIGFSMWKNFKGKTRLIGNENNAEKASLIRKVNKQYY